jgi:hypothetical protein
MKKFKILFSIFFFLFLMSYATFLSIEKIFRFSHYSFKWIPFLSHKWILSTKSCWNENNYPLFKDKNPEIRFMEHASNECPSPEYPIIFIKDIDATHWIQIVNVNTQPPHNKSSLQIDRWVFVDVSDDFNKLNIPFYYTLTPNNKFRDNPGWNYFINPFKKENLHWQAIVFSFSIKDKVVTPRFAFTWGYKIDYQNVLISAVYPQQIDILNWEKYRSYFNTQYPQWIFKKTIKEEEGK